MSGNYTQRGNIWGAGLNAVGNLGGALITTLGNNAVSITGPSASVEIRVKAENESIRTYTINIIKTDYKSSDATLKSLTVEGIDFAFKSNT